MEKDIHQGQPIIHYGEEFEDADLVVILLHGRGATAESMLPIAKAIQSKGTRFLMPQAAMERWYPNSAFVPLDANEPDLSSALSLIDSLVSDIQDEGFSLHQIAFGGFSQGACLAAEYVARHPAEYAGLFVFSGALVGPRDAPRDYSGSFNGMPVFIGGSDVDPWVSHDLLSRTAEFFDRMNANINFITYQGMAHTINQDEVDRVRDMLAEARQIVINP